MAKEAMRVKHTKKGMQKLFKNILLLQQNYVTVGIHKSDNKITSGARQSKEWKQLQKHLRQMEEGIGSNSSPESGSGLDKSASKGSKTRKRRRSFNLASLAYYLEQPVSWIQSKTVSMFTKSGETVTIHAGARIVRPARTFISIFKIPNIWNNIDKFVQEQIRNLYFSHNKGKSSFWKSLGNITKLEQKGIIQTSSSAANSDLTTKIKGENHPLFDTGGLLESINYKVNKNPSGKQLEQNAFLLHFNSEMRKLK